MSRRLPAHARKNFAFLIPFAPLLVPALVGGVALVGAGYAAKTAAEPYINTPAVFGGALGYVAAASTKQSTAVQAGSILVGYLGGLLIGNAIKKQADKKAVEKIMAEEGVKTTAEATKIADWRKWCKEHNYLAYVTPQCYAYEV